MDAKAFEQTYNEQSLQVAHALPPVDLARSFTADKGEIAVGTLLKRTTPGGLIPFAFDGVDASGAAQTIAVAGILSTDRIVAVLRAVGGDSDVTDLVISDVFTVTDDDELTQASGDLSLDSLVALVSRNPAGTFEPWIQGTDHPDLIAGIMAGSQTLDTDTNEVGLVRVFGPVRKDTLVAWTAADGSTTADPNAAALAELASTLIFAL